MAYQNIMAVIERACNAQELALLKNLSAKFQDQLGEWEYPYAYKMVGHEEPWTLAYLDKCIQEGSDVHPNFARDFKDSLLKFLRTKNGEDVNRREEMSIFESRTTLVYRNGDFHEVVYETNDI